LLFSDETSNTKRKPLVVKLLSEARTQLFAEAERRLPVRAADVCVSTGANGTKGTSSLEATVVHDAVGAEHAGLKTILSIRVLEEGKIRVTTASGKTTTLGREENFPFNGWIGKSGDQIRASVKIPGIPDYSTVTIDLK
jgi:hypothetical protein